MLTCVFAIQDAGGSLPAACAGYEGGSDLYQLSLAGGAGLRALAQQVPVADFGEEALRERLADPAHLEIGARTHDALVTAAAVGGAVVPLPLATLFTDRTRALATLSARAGQFRVLLDRLRGNAEWAVKVHLTQGATGPDAPDERDRSGSESMQSAHGAGRAYLDRVRARRQRQQDREAAAVAEAARIDETLASLAKDAAHRRLHGTQVTGRHRSQILNGAYLVDGRRAEQLRDAVAGLRARADLVEIEVSGP